MRSLSPAAKRGVDLAAAIVLLVAQLPLLPLVALAILIESRGPVFVFRPVVGMQRRRPRADGRPDRDPRRVHDVGGRLLRVPEFRVASVPRTGHPARLTRVGRLLLKTRLAYGPRLLSVLLGDLALVGPRALSPHDVAELRRRVPAWDTLLVDVKPGLLGPAQAQGRRGTGWVTALRDRIFFELDYGARLRRATRVRDLLALDLTMVRACWSAALRSRVPLGHEVIRIDAPARAGQAPVDVRALMVPESFAPTPTGASPRGPSVELHPHGDRLTAFWYPARRRALHLPTAPAPTSPIDLLHTADEPFDARWLVAEERRDRQLLVVHALRADPALTSAPADELHVDLPGGLHEVARLCEQLLPLWEALGGRRGEPALADRMTRLLLAGLARVAAGRADGRITLDVHVAADRIVLQFTAQLPLPELSDSAEFPLPRVVIMPSIGAVPLAASASAARPGRETTPAAGAPGLPLSAGGRPQCPAHDTPADQLRPR